jgi:hypothetical protein
LGTILEKFSEWLVAREIPVFCTSLNIPTIDPVAAVLSFQLMARKNGTVDYRAEDAGGPQIRSISYLIERNLGAQHWKLEDREAVKKIPALPGIVRARHHRVCPATRAVLSNSWPLSRMAAVARTANPDKRLIGIGNPELVHAPRLVLRSLPENIRRHSGR